MTKTKTAYLANSWFNDEQNAFREAGMSAIKKNKTLDWENSYRPIEHQFRGLNTMEHPELLSDSLWQVATWNGDITAVENADITIGLYDPKPENSDVGVIYEIAYAKAIRKPVYLVLPDDCKESLNLMPAIGVTRVLHLKDLTTFNFNDYSYELTDLEVY